MTDYSITRLPGVVGATLLGAALLALPGSVLAQDNAPQPGENADNQPGQPLNTPAEAEGPAAQAIAKQLQSVKASNKQIKDLQAFYKNNGYGPVWFDTNGTPRDNTHAYFSAVSHVDADGLEPASYQNQTLQDVVNGEVRIDSPEALARYDVALSEQFLALAHDLHTGVVDDSSIHVQWQEPNAPVDYQEVLARAADGHIKDALVGLAPQQPGYQQLKKALARYQQIADDGGWPQIPEGEVLREGMDDPRIATLWTRLQATGDAPDDQSAPKAYDDTIMSAMKHYQTRNGLKDDGLLGPSTRDALNVTADQRIDDIKLNMERWRWMPASFGERYIEVNVPAFELDAFDANGSNESQHLEMKVIVGGSYNDRETPIFGDSMQYLVFRPYWNVPPSIAADEIVPKQRDNPDYMASKHYQIVANFGPNAQPMAITPANVNAVAAGDLLVRQDGGPDNALGLVKFIFPNDMAIYLHSTSAQQLFDRTDRDLSHGCVRVEDPIALAAFALKGDASWTRADIDHAMHTGGRKRVDLPKSIPVYMQYWTAFVDDDTVNFRADIYHHDNELESALKSKAAVAL